MFFLTLSNADIQFDKKELIQKTYIAAETLFIIKQVELTDKKKFVKAAFDENSETFVVHISALQVSEKTIHLSQTAQIIGSDSIQVTALKQNKAFTKIPTKYSNFIDVFSGKKALMLPK